MAMDTSESSIDDRIKTIDSDLKEKLAKQIIRAAAVSRGFFRQQQKDEPDLNLEEKEQIVTDLLLKNEAEFLNPKTKWSTMFSISNHCLFSISRDIRFALLPAGVAFAIQYCPSLSDLSLGGCSSLDVTVVSSLLLSTLTTLQMNGQYPQMTNSSEFAKIGNIPTLKSLNVSFNDMVCDDLLTNLASVGSLISLDVSGCNGRVRENSGVTDAGVRNLKNIVELDISYLSGVSDRALRHLSTVKSLKTVKICGAPDVTNNGISALVTLSSLTKLDMSGCRGVNSLFSGGLLEHRRSFSKHLDLILGGTNGTEGLGVDHCVNIDNVTIHLFNNYIENLRPGYFQALYEDYDFDSDGGWSNASDAGSEQEYDGVGEIDEAIALPMVISDTENDVNNSENNVMPVFYSVGNMEEADNDVDEEDTTETAEDINNERGQNYEDSETTKNGEEAEEHHDNEMEKMVANLLHD